MQSSRTSLTALIAVIGLLGLIGTACAGDTDAGDVVGAASVGEGYVASGDGAGIRLVSADQGASMQNDPPADLVILDVRTPEEFGDGHLDGAVLLDFYEEDFAVNLAELDPGVPYLLYCRSGNRSGQTAAMMRGLGFTDVADVDGGVVAWQAAGLPLVN